MSNIYMYPKNDYETLESPNPYVLHVEKSLSEKHKIINTTPNNKGVVDLFFFLFKTDIFFFNWIEDISVKRFGKIQSLLFPLFVILAKIFNKKIFWVLHNKYSHEKKNRSWIRFGFKLMMKHSDAILTHSNSGVEFVKKEFPKHSYKVKYLVHPLEEMLPDYKKEIKKHDLLIWGTIHPYKGVIDFLKYAQQSPAFDEIKIAISGECPDPREKKALSELLTENIIHIDEFQSMEDIAKLAGDSRFVLFSYNSESILSSGSLMDSIRMRSIIIGPDKGAFKDLKSFSFINTYSSFNEIPKIIKNYGLEDKKTMQEIERFYSENSWEIFGEKLFETFNEIL